ncbi:MAG: indolepyruvate oxidoreductase subunit beta [Candidatus Kariarchaeaceae archaeon]|jgi:indolepyruvate ferredoxin oxidoreductase beta subunit
MFDLIVVGVGGQGTVSIGHLLGKACMKMDLPFVSSETHGMSQRGGSVIFHMRMGNQSAPLIPKGRADAILAGEPMEALRFLDYLKPNGVILSNKHGILSPVAMQFGISYPDINDIWNTLQSWPASVYKIDSTAVAKEMGLVQGENMVLLGAFMGLGVIPIDFEIIKEIIAERWPRFVESNYKALEVGFEQIQGIMKVRTN